MPRERKQTIHVVGDSDTLCGFPLVHEEPHPHLIVIYDVEGIDDIVEAKANGGLNELSLREATSIKATTAIKELA